MKNKLLLILLLLIMPLFVHSDTIEDQITDIGSELLCPVCQGQSVAESNSGLAQDMRATIRKKLKEGQTKEEIISYFRASYGDTILGSPPARGFNLFLWLLPVLSLSIGAIIIFRVLQTYKKPTEEKETTEKPGTEYIEKVENEIKD